MCESVVVRSGSKENLFIEGGSVSDRIEVRLEPSLLSRHRPSSLQSHFDGTEEDLKYLTKLAWNFEAPGKKDYARNSHILSKANPKRFFCKFGAVRVRDGVMKRRAARVDLIVRVTKYGPHGRVDEIELVDIQAWPGRGSAYEMAA